MHKTCKPLESPGRAPRDPKRAQESPRRAPEHKTWGPPGGGTSAGDPGGHPGGSIPWTSRRKKDLDILGDLRGDIPGNTLGGTPMRFPTGDLPGDSRGPPEGWGNPFGVSTYGAPLWMSTHHLPLNNLRNWGGYLRYPTPFGNLMSTEALQMGCHPIVGTFPGPPRSPHRSPLRPHPRPHLRTDKCMPRRPPLTPRACIHSS